MKYFDDHLDFNNFKIPQVPALKTFQGVSAGTDYLQPDVPVWCPRKQGKLLFKPYPWTGNTELPSGVAGGAVM